MKNFAKYFLIPVTALVLGLSVTTCTYRSKSQMATLKGVPASNLPSDKVGVDYGKLYPVEDPCEPEKPKKKTVTYTAMFGFATDNANVNQGGLGKEIKLTESGQPIDIGAISAYTFINWLKAQNNGGLFPGILEELTNSFPAEIAQVSFGSFYTYSAIVRNLRVAYRDGNNAVVNTVIDFKIEIILGASVFHDSRTAMSSDFSDAMAKALVNSDIFAYNGNLWTYPDNLPSSPGNPNPTDSATLDLVNQIKVLGGRQKYGVFIFNMCFGEKIEEALYNAMLNGRTPGTDDFLVLSHRRYSNYAYFAEQQRRLIVNFLHGQSLPKLLLDMAPAAVGNWTDPTGFDNPAESVQLFQQYVNSAEAIGNDDAVVPVVRQPE